MSEDDEPLGPATPDDETPLGDTPEAQLATHVWRSGVAEAVG